MSDGYFSICHGDKSVFTTFDSIIGWMHYIIYGHPIQIAKNEWVGENEVSGRVKIVGNKLKWTEKKNWELKNINAFFPLWLHAFSSKHRVYKISKNRLIWNVRVENDQWTTVNTGSGYRLHYRLHSCRLPLADR